MILHVLIYTNENIAEARCEVTIDDYINDMAETKGMMLYEEERELRGGEGG